MEDLRLYVGRRDTKIYFVELFQQELHVAKVILHPEYDYATLNGDIAILVLKEEIYFTEGVKVTKFLFNCIRKLITI